jgi:hypothetical protein
MKEFTLYRDGRCVLTENTNLVWSGDSDDEYQAEFGESVEPGDVDDILDYLLEAGYLEEDESIDIVDEFDENTDTVRTLAGTELEGEFDDGDEPEELH